jgi:hypothetical protein
VIFWAIIAAHAVAFTAVAIVVTRDVRRANRSHSCPSRSLLSLNSQLFR